MADKQGKTSVRLPESKLKELNEIKEKHGISINFLIRRGINFIVAKYKEMEKVDNENNSTNPKS